MGNGETKEKPKAGTRPPLIKSIIALFLWMGLIQFNVVLLISAFFLPIRLGASIVAFLVLMRLIPLSPKSKFGSKVSRFISKNAFGYFPVTVHVEDEKAFDPDQAYGNYALSNTGADLCRGKQHPVPLLDSEI